MLGDVAIQYDPYSDNQMRTIWYFKGHLIGMGLAEDEVLNYIMEEEDISLEVAQYHWENKEEL